MPRLYYNCTDVIEDWLPLGGPPAPEAIPICWSGPHVGKRLIEAFRTLARMPGTSGPQAYGNF